MDTVNKKWRRSCINKNTGNRNVYKTVSEYKVGMLVIICYIFLNESPQTT